MVSKSTLFDIALITLFIGLTGYVLYMTHSNSNEIKELKIKSEFDSVKRLDSLNSIQQKIYRKQLDSIVFVLNKQDSLSLIKDRQQDAKIRAINSRTGVLPIL